MANASRLRVVLFAQLSHLSHHYLKLRSQFALAALVSILDPPIVSRTLYSLHKMAVLNYTEHGVIHPSVSSIIKRSLDVVGALVGLAFVSAVLVPIAIAIKLDSPGPIFYGQM